MRAHLTAFPPATLLLALCVPACAQTAPAPPMSEVTTRYPVTTAQLAGREIRLGEQAGMCTLVRGDAVLPLGVHAPCYFSINRKHSAQVHHFQGSDIVLVQHARPTSRPDWDSARYGPICTFESQAVREVGGVLEPGVVASSWHCDPSAGADQKQFVYSYGTWPRRETLPAARRQRAR